jgi:hypothetical protein
MLNTYYSFAQSCRQVLALKNPSTILILTLLCEQADEHGQCAVHYDWLLRNSGYVSRNVVSAAIKTLTTLGLITRKRRLGLCALYTINLDALTALPNTSAEVTR